MKDEDEAIAIVLLIMLVVCGIPSYYLGKAIQRGENRDNCKTHQKVEISVGEWVACVPPEEKK